MGAGLMGDNELFWVIAGFFAASVGFGVGVGLGSWEVMLIFTILLFLNCWSLTHSIKKLEKSGGG